MKRLLSAMVLTLISTAATATGPVPIKVSSAWLRATPKGAPVAGGYATITNTGPTADRLMSASLAVAPTGEIHSMTMDHGVMHMERLDKGLLIAAGATVTLAPGGFHLMFLKPTATLKVGQTIGGTLIFEKAGSISVPFAVGGMAAKAAPGQSTQNMGDMPGMDMR